jgi:hypothetical protein
MKDVMIDFETFGNGKDKCVCQIGAIYFDRITGELGESYKANIDAASHVKRGGKIDGETVYWWLQQSDAARNSLLNPPPRDVVEVMNELNQFLSKAERIWSHATFDFVTLSETLRTLGIKPTFKYKAGLDLRTLVYLAGISTSDFPREGVHHDGLADSIHQVKYAVAAMNAVKGNKQFLNMVKRLG